MVSPYETAKNSMRMRLILIPASILLLGVIAVIGVTLFDAGTRIASEVASGLNLGDLLIGYALDDLATSDDPDAALRRLRIGLSHVRHIEVSYLAQSPDTAIEPAKISPLDPRPSRRSFAPDWFLHWFEPARIEKTYSVSIAGMPRGTLVMSSKPSDEAAEICESLVFSTSLLTAISIAIIALILVTARHTLKPIHQLVEGLDRLGRGRFDVLAEVHISELRRIGDRFNHLARTLARAEAENHLLIDRLLSLQEAERKELARELHDEFGALLFGIRAAASCIIEAAETGLADTGLAETRLDETGLDETGLDKTRSKEDIIERAQTISAMADAIQKQNYRILDRIRPVILHQMGLPDALRHLVSSWRVLHREFDCDIELPTESPPPRAGLDEEISLTSYRIVQECLTNVARHSKAKFVRVAMDYRSGPCLRLRVEDDGVGLPPDFAFGFGFLGMSERVRKLGGHLKIANGARAGTMIEAAIPLGEAAPLARSVDSAGAARRLAR